MALLEITDLQVSFATPDGTVQAVRGLSFSVDAGQTLCIVGESGSGKSVATQTIAGLTRGAKVSGQAFFEGRDLLTMTPKQLQAIRGPKIGMIFQDPLSSLHPYYRVGWQIGEVIRAHQPHTSKAEARVRAIELLHLVGIPQADSRVDDFPHPVSPTRPSVSPRRISRLTPSTACTCSWLRRIEPDCTGNCFTTVSTETRTSSFTAPSPPARAPSVERPDRSDRGVASTPTCGRGARRSGGGAVPRSGTAP